MNRYLSSIIQKSSWKKAALFTVLFVALYILINFSGVGVAGLLKITGGANILDFEFGYTQEEAYQMLTALGTEGRSFYLINILPLDFPFPFTYMLFYAGWIALLIKRVTTKVQYKYILFISVMAMLFDWAENVGIITMLNNYPDLPLWTVFLASIAGILKRIFTIGSIAIIGLLFIIYLIKKYRKII